MTLNEFKAWFDGFTENVSKVPTLKQWARIKERVTEIDGTAVTERIYVDRWYPYRQWYPHNWPLYGTVSAVSNTASEFVGASTVVSNSTALASFNSIDAMHAAGQAEAASMEKN